VTVLFDHAGVETTSIELRRIEAEEATTAMARMPSGALVQLIRYEPDSPDLAAVDGRPE
jgi:hypothetical protein